MVGPLSKRLASVSLRQLRRDGVEPEALAGYLATLGTGRERWQRGRPIWWPASTSGQ